MIILFEENETQFLSLGLGTLKDAISCKVTEKLNDSFELSMTYPVTGKEYDKLKINRIVYCKANPYDEAQPFRIYSITKPLNGVVTVDAVHISYDMNGIPVKPVDGQNMQEVLLEIQNEKFDSDNNPISYTLVDNPFKFTADVSFSRSYKTTAPYNLRAILMGADESLLAKYDAEVKFDKYNVSIVPKRGKNRGAKVVYAHNMTDLNHQTSNETLYNGIFPYYHKETTSTKTSSEDKFTQVYIVGGKPFVDGWLSYTENGEPFHPLDSGPVQIATEGDYFEKVYTWDTMYQNFVERIYNEQLIVVQGVLEPSWITIDWSKFPTIICRANKKGYFKKSGDTDWGEIKGVGDPIFEGSIVSSGIIENLILNFSEVIPSTGNKENEEVTEIVDVQLENPIIWIDEPDAKNLLHNNVLCVDLSSEFDEDPSQNALKVKAEEYIIKNKLGKIKHTTTVSFVDLASTTEADKYQNFDHIELGDTVRVVYLDLGVDVDLRVISTEYDPISKRYDNIELGEKEEKLSESSIQTGDNISSLVNDRGYADVTTVKKLIAETITAEYLEAINAKLSTAQIKQLEVERINATGIIEASQFNLDTLIAKLLVAENAQISNTLTAGNIKVAGDITVNSGEIKIQNEGENTFFRVDREGNLTANAVTITGGELNLGEGVFLVQNDGTLFAANATIEGYIVATAGEIGGCIIENGVLKVPKENIVGTITANSIEVKDDDDNVILSADSDEGTATIADFIVEYGRLRTANITGIDDIDHDGVYLGTDGIMLGKGNFKVLDDGTLFAANATIEGEIVANSGKIGGCIIDENGNLKVPVANIEGTITATSIIVKNSEFLNADILFSADSENYTVKIAKFNVGVDKIDLLRTIGYLKTVNITGIDDITHDGVYLGDNGVMLGRGKFKVLNTGKVYASDIEITGGSLHIEDQATGKSYTIDPTGSMTMNSGQIQLGKQESEFSASIYLKDKTDSIRKLVYKGKNTLGNTVWETVISTQPLTTVTISTGLPVTEDGSWNPAINFGVAISTSTDETYFEVLTAPLLLGFSIDSLPYSYYNFEVGDDDHDIDQFILRNGRIKLGWNQQCTNGYYTSNMNNAITGESDTLEYAGKITISGTTYGIWRSTINPYEVNIHLTDAYVNNNALTKAEENVKWYHWDGESGIGPYQSYYKFQNFQVIRPSVSTEYYNFEVDEDGNMIANSGKIAGFDIQNTYICNGTKQTVGSVYLGTDGIYLGTSFYVTPTGFLHATAGTIANMSISSNSLEYSSNAFSIKPGEVFNPTPNQSIPNASIKANSAQFKSLVGPYQNLPIGWDTIALVDDIANGHEPGFVSLFVSETNVVYNSVIRLSDFPEIPIIQGGMSGLTPAQAASLPGRVSYCPKIRVYKLGESWFDDGNWKTLDISGDNNDGIIHAIFAVSATNLYKYNSSSAQRRDIDVCYSGTTLRIRAMTNSNYFDGASIIVIGY